jgi:hypothetical protein
MHCCCCDKLLNDYESTRKNAETGEYLDMCNKCYGTIANDLKSDNRSDLDEFEILDSDLEFDSEEDYDE